MDRFNLVKTVAEVILPFVVLYFALITEVITPLAVRGFFCTDQSLRLPYMEGSVSNNAVYATGGLPLIFVSSRLMITSFPVRKPLLYFAVALEVAEPFVVRGFFCGEQRLSYPYTTSTVPNSLIYGTGTLPLIFVVVTAYNVIPFKKLYRIWVSYAFGITSIYLFMNIMKLFYGELRPNFFEACQPHWPSMNCSGYVSEFTCTGPSKKAAIESMRSFPSSHAGITAFGMFYLIIFTQEVFINRRNSYHLGWAIFQWAGFLWAMYAGLSRITDNKHHLHDVLAGFFIGSTTSYWVAYQWSGLGEIGNPKAEHDGKTKNHVITHCSCQNGISVGKPKES